MGGKRTMKIATKQYIVILSILTHAGLIWWIVFGHTLRRFEHHMLHVLKLDDWLALIALGVTALTVEFLCRGRIRTALRQFILLGWTCGWGYEFEMFGMGFPIGWMIWLGIYLAGLGAILKLLPAIRRRFGLPDNPPAEPRGFEVVPTDSIPK